MSGSGYIVCTTVRTYAPICTKCSPAWKPPDVEEDGPYDTHEEALEVIEEHDKACHRPGPGA